MKNVGIWIDTQEANIVILDSGKITVKSVFSGTSRKQNIKGETSKKTARGFIGFDYKSTQENRFREELKRYLRTVINEVKGSHNLYVFGPAEAKLLLEKEMKKDGFGGSRLLKVEACDKLTPNQLIEKVRNFYTERDRIKPVRRRLPR